MLGCLRARLEHDGSADQANALSGSERSAHSKKEICGSLNVSSDSPPPHGPLYPTPPVLQVAFSVVGRGACAPCSRTWRSGPRTRASQSPTSPMPFASIPIPPRFLGPHRRHPRITCAALLTVVDTHVMAQAGGKTEPVRSVLSHDVL